MNKKNKKGSHIGFAIAFVLFIGFVIFLLAMLRPLGKIDSDKDFLIKHLENQIIENSSSELTMISISSNSQSPCLDISSLNLGNYVVAKDKNGDLIDSSSTIVEKSNFVKIYSSNESFNPQTSCTGTISSDYQIGLVRKENLIFESKIIGLINNYNLDYETMKSNFNVPKNNDFEVGFIYSNGTEIKSNERDVPQTEVFAELVPVTYVNKNADRNIGYIRVALW